MPWCPRCKTDKPHAEFNLRDDGQLQDACVDCRALKSRQAKLKKRIYKEVEIRLKRFIRM